MPEPFPASVPTRRDARAAPPGAGNPDKLGTEAEKGLAPRVERHGVASGVRTNPQGRQAFRVCPALLSTPWHLHIGYTYLSDTTLVKPNEYAVSKEGCGPEFWQNLTHRKPDGGKAFLAI